jgi:hypothetical protein
VSLSPFTYYIALCAQNHSGWLKPAAASRREDKRREEKILGHNKHLSLSLSLSLSFKLEYDDRKKKHMML